MTRAYLTVVLVCLLGLVVAHEASGQVEIPHAELVANEVVGAVFFADGETPVASFPVRLWSVDQERFLYRTRTNAQGEYRVPRLRAGRTYLMVGRVKIDLQVLAEEPGTLMQRHDIIVILPRRTLLTAKQVLYDYFAGMLPLLALPEEPREPEIVSP